MGPRPFSMCGLRHYCHALATPTVSRMWHGGAHPGRGTGLVGLTDRIEALGGRLILHSPPGAGTPLYITLPPHRRHVTRTPATGQPAGVRPGGKAGPPA